MPLMREQRMGTSYECCRSAIESGRAIFSGKVGGRELFGSTRTGTAFTPAATAPLPITAPTMACVVETGAPRYVARCSHSPAAKSAANHHGDERVGLQSVISDDQILRPSVDHIATGQDGPSRFRDRGGLCYWRRC